MAKDLIDQIGSALGQANPFRKPGLQDIPKIVAPKDVMAPTGPTGGPNVVQGMPAPLPGTQIAAPVGPTGQQLDLVGSNQVRDYQSNLMSQLAGQAAGTGPSVAANQLKVGQEATLAASLAAANSARGGANPALARAALQSNAQASGQMAMEAANQRLQEQMQAAGMLGQVAQGARGQDIETAAQQAQLNQQAQLASYQGQLQAAVAQGQITSQEAQMMYQTQAQTAQKNLESANQYNALVAQYAAMGMDAQSANQAANLQYQQLKQGGVTAANQQTVQQDAANKQMIGQIAGAAGAAVAASDRRSKTAIKSGDGEIAEFLNALSAHSYRYKDERDGKGRFVSPMAQELLKTKLGATMVEPSPTGLMVNYGRGLATMLAAQATLNKRLAKLEENENGAA